MGRPVRKAARIKYWDADIPPRQGRIRKDRMRRRAGEKGQAGTAAGGRF